MNNLLLLFGKFLGTGRAFWVRTQSFKAVVTAIISLFYVIHTTIKNTYQQNFPYLVDDYSLPFWEANYNISVKEYSTTQSRKAMIMARWINQGNQAAAHLQFIFNQAGYDVTVEENLDATALENDWENGIKIANGDVFYFNNGVFTLDDRVNTPTTDFEWRKVFIVSGDIEYTNYESIKDIILEYKRASQVCIMVDTTSLEIDLDANLVDSLTMDYDLDANSCSISNPPLYDLDSNLVIFP